MLQAIGRKTAHAGQTIVTVTSTHAKVSVVQAAMRDLARWLYPAERQPCDCERFIDPEKPGDQMNYRILYGAVRSLWDQKMHGISTLVFITAIVVPSL